RQSRNSVTPIATHRKPKTVSISRCRRIHAVPSSSSSRRVKTNYLPGALESCVMLPAYTQYPKRAVWPSCRVVEKARGALLDALRDLAELRGDLGSACRRQPV